MTSGLASVPSVSDKPRVCNRSGKQIFSSCQLSLISRAWLECYLWKDSGTPCGPQRTKCSVGRWWLLGCGRWAVMTCSKQLLFLLLGVFLLSLVKWPTLLMLSLWIRLFYVSQKIYKAELLHLLNRALNRHFRELQRKNLLNDCSPPPKPPFAKSLRKIQGQRNRPWWNWFPSCSFLLEAHLPSCCQLGLS